MMPGRRHAHKVLLLQNARTIDQHIRHSPATLERGSELLRRWVDDAAATPADLDALAAPDEHAWREERRDALLYA